MILIAVVNTPAGAFSKNWTLHSKHCQTPGTGLVCSRDWWRRIWLIISASVLVSSDQPAHVAHLPPPLKVGAQTKISRISKMDWSCVIPIRMCMNSTVSGYWCLPSSLWLQTIALVDIYLRCLWWSNICNLLFCRNFLCRHVRSAAAWSSCCQFEKLCKFPKLSFVIA